MRTEPVILLETVLDHLTGEELGLALEALNGMAAVLDAIYLPATGKKNRPAGLLQVLCRPENEKAAAEAVFMHTHSLGLRRQELERYVLDRSHASMQLCGETVAAKAHTLNNQDYLRPEADAVRELAKKLGTGAPGLRFYRKSPESHK